MSWTEYYTLLIKYDGDLKKATDDELECARLGNPNDPITAQRMADEKFKEAKKALRERRIRVGEDDLKELETIEKITFQTTRYWTSRINRGMCVTLKAIAVIVTRKINDGLKPCVHTKKEMEIPRAEYSDGRAIREGVITSTHNENLGHLHRHGFIAKFFDNGVKRPGNWIITPKGWAFLKGEAFPLIAIADKADHYAITYFKPEKYRCKITDFKKLGEEMYWEGTTYPIEMGEAINELDLELPFNGPEYQKKLEI